MSTIPPAEPLVTILLPTYARAHFLPEALESLLCQTHGNLEILVFDDASPDDTYAVAQSFAKRDSRVRVVRHPGNLGIVGNWQAAFATAQGEFVCLLEDDDRFLPDFVAKMIAALQQDDRLILSFCDHYAIRADGTRDDMLTHQMARQFGRDRLPPGPVADFLRTATIDVSVGITAAMFRRAYLPQNLLDERAGGGADLYLLYRCARTGYGATYLPDRLMEYRVHQSGMSHSRPELMNTGHLFLYETLLEDPFAARLRPALRQKSAQVATARGLSLLREADVAKQRESRAVLLRSLRTVPTLRAFVALLLTYLPNGGAFARRIRRG